MYMYIMYFLDFLFGLEFACHSWLLHKDLLEQAIRATGTIVDGMALCITWTLCVGIHVELSMCV